jgi:tetratricopeptide (TPR) repeat protein
MRITFSFLCVIASLGAGFGLHDWNQTDLEARLLEPGAPLRREISAQQPQIYRLRTPPGRFVRVRLEQEGVDVALSRLGPKGETLLVANRTKIGGEESFSYLEREAGEQRVEVRVAGQAATSGAYRIRVELLDTPGPKDIERASAERLLAIAGSQSGDEAMETLDQALSVWRVIGDDVWETATLNALGDAALQLSRCQDAVEYSARALDLSLKIQDQSGELRARSNLGDAYLHSNRAEKAIEQYEAALPLIREAQDRAAESATLDNLSDAYLKLGLSERAIRMRELALSLKQALVDKKGAAETLCGLGRIHQAIGQYETSMDRYKQALTAFGERGVRTADGSVLASIGLVALEKGEREKAIESLEQALIRCRETGDRRCESEALSGLGRVRALIRDQERAKRDFEQALSIEREMRNPSMEAQTLFRFAIAERQWGRPERAQSLIENSLRLIESLSVDAYEPEQKNLPSAASQRAYQFYIDLLMQLDRANPGKGFDAMAFGAGERARARRQVELLAEARFDLVKNIDRALRDRKRTLTWRMNELSRRLSQRRGPAETAELQREWDRLNVECIQAGAVLRRDSPRYAALTDPAWPELDDIQQQLDDETLLLEYSLGEERSFLWAVGRNSIDSFELPQRRRIVEEATRLHEYLTARSRSIKDETSAQTRARVSQADVQLPIAARVLSQTLLGPVADKLKSKRLVIVAEDILQYTPFAMLPPPKLEAAKVETTDARGGEPASPPGGDQRDAGDKNASSRTSASGIGDALIFDHEIIYLSSASGLALHRRELKKRPPATGDVAVFADPVLYANDKRIRLISVRPVDENPKPATENDLISTRVIEQFAQDYGGESTGEPTIPRLSHTQIEADRILAASPPGATNLRAVGFLANRATATSAHLAQYRYLHFAAYGLLDGRTPGFSTLVLSLVNHEGKAKDGLLRASEIYELNLPAELVVMSACQASLENGSKGEGLLGLTDSFLYAGASRVTISLWNANHKSTADFMSRYYLKILREGLSPAAALRAAQLDMLRQRQWQAPYFWAGFSLFGEWN